MRGIRNRHILGCRLASCGLLLGCLAALAPWGRAADAALDPAHLVEFRSEAPRDPSWPKDSDKISGYLFRPEGAGPFPAVVFLHGCGGFHRTFKRRERHWARRFLRWGYVVLIPDSLTPRGVRNICRRGENHGITNSSTRDRDAYGALQFLQGLPFVHAGRVGAMGWSHGGGTLMYAMRGEQDKRIHPLPGDTAARFGAAVAMYPRCPRSGRIFYAPLLILIGESDDWTFAARCKTMAPKSRAGGGPVNLKVYAGAHHGFDAKRKRSIEYLGHHIEYDRVAAKDAAREVKAFFAQHLKWRKRARGNQ